MRRTLSPIRGCVDKFVMTRPRLLVGVLLLGAGVARAQIVVPSEAPVKAKATTFHDSRYGVRFEVPAGWSFGRKDRQVSTFHVDARSASKKAEMRGVASILFNPFPYSTFSGAWFYFSVARHSNDGDCARQASVGAGEPRDVLNIGGMDFRHGHDEQGKMCVESRDEVYTAYRKGACYRFDLTVGTFCSISSGAREMSEGQLADIDGRMKGILQSVVLDWAPVEGSKGGASGRRKLPAGRKDP
jgi:hypothetical protein